LAEQKNSLSPNLDPNLDPDPNLDLDPNPDLDLRLAAFALSLLLLFSASALSCLVNIRMSQ